MDQLNPQKLDQALANSAKAIEDSWTTVGLQRGMSSLVRDMSEDFEKVFAASEDIKKLMQGVYNTFIEKFAFQKMKVPSLDLDPHRTKLQLLVHQTEAFVKDPVNVVVKEKHFVVKNFYNTLVKAARSNFGDAKSQAERWMQAVILPLEVQIKDHKGAAAVAPGQPRQDQREDHLHQRADGVAEGGRERPAQAARDDRGAHRPRLGACGHLVARPGHAGHDHHCAAPRRGHDGDHEARDLRDLAARPHAACAAAAQARGAREAPGVRRPHGGHRQHRQAGGCPRSIPRRPRRCPPARTAPRR
jgi:hypothetical protein